MSLVIYFYALLMTICTIIKMLDKTLIGLFQGLSYLGIHLLDTVLKRMFFKFVFGNNFKFTEKLQKYYGELLQTLYPDSSIFNICPICFIILSVHLHTNIHMHTHIHNSKLFMNRLHTSCLFILNTLVCIS